MRITGILLALLVVSQFALAIPNPAYTEVKHDLRLNSNRVVMIVPGPNGPPPHMIIGVNEAILVEGFVKNPTQVMRELPQVIVTLSQDGKKIYEKTIPLAPVVKPAIPVPQFSYNLTINLRQDLGSRLRDGAVKVQAYVAGFDLTATAYTEASVMRLAW